jgi:hypothetical protein
MKRSTAIRWVLYTTLFLVLVAVKDPVIHGQQPTVKPGPTSSTPDNLQPAQADLQPANVRLQP